MNSKTMRSLLHRGVALILSVVLAVGLAACNQNDTPMNESEPSSQTDLNSSAETTTEQTTNDMVVESEKTTVQNTPVDSKKTNAPKPPANSSTPKQQPNAHTHNYTKNVVAATCTQKGYTLNTCGCGDSFKSDYVDAGHSFKGYKCSKCGAVDKSHSFEYLSQWLLDNGQVFADYSSIEKKSGSATLAVKFYPDEGDIAFSYFNTDIDGNGTFMQSMLFLYPGETSVSYICGNDDCKISGKIDASKYTSKYPLSSTSCKQGPYTVYELTELARQQINNMLNQVKDLLSEKKTGVSVADLGFKAY